MVSLKLGSASAIKMLRIDTTTNNSISVKPLILLVFLRISTLAGGSLQYLRQFDTPLDYDPSSLCFLSIVPIVSGR